MTLVVDASVVIKWFVEENLRDQARHILKYQRELAAPEFMLVEVANIAWKKVRRKEIGEDQARFIVESLPQYIPPLIPTRDIIEAATQLALDLDHPVYDCIYLACAQNLGAAVTADRKFFERVKKSAHAGLIKFVDDSDLQLPLFISIDRIDEIIKLSDLLKKTQGNVFEKLFEGKESGLNIVSSEDWEPIRNSPSFRNIFSYLEALPQDELVDVLALCWLAQGRSSSAEWSSMREDAEQNVRSIGPDYIPYICSRTFHLENGLAILQGHSPLP